MAGRRIEVARGKVVGGSSSINAMAYVRGNRADYDRWASQVLPDWSYGNVLPYFRKSESWEGGSDEYRGGSGPLATRKSRYQDPLVDAYLEAAQAAGYAFNEDYNGERQDGFARMQVTVRNGWRESAATAYLRPALARENLGVVIDAHVARVAFEGSRAVGVEYVKGGHAHSVEASREVILCAGSINSPQLLMLSGVGDGDALRELEIPVKVHLPGVGRNLQDHLAALLIYGRSDESPLLRNMRLDRMAVGLTSGLLFGKGFATDLPGGITAFVKSSPDAIIPDTQLLFISGSLLASPYLPPFKQPFADSFACRIVLLRPESRGRVTLASADPLAHPRIFQCLLSADGDWGTLRNGIRIFRELARSRQLRRFVASEIGPGADVVTDAELEAYTRKTAVTAHHPAGTCRMGSSSDEMTVVDSELRVIGVDGLRVVDASVFPDLVGGNINATVIMIAEKAADMIRGRRAGVG
jgi:choline dehydrogenase/4-pyridoxate dehydrogenase